MSTERRMDYDPTHQKKLIDNIDKIYKGETLECPSCGKKSAIGKFYFFTDGEGYCIVECEECNAAVQVLSRVIRSEKIKAQIVKVE